MKLNRTSSSFGWLVGCGMTVAAAGCGSNAQEDPVPASEAAMRFAFGTIPSDVFCVEAQVTGATRTTVKQEDVFPGTSPTLFMSGLPTGEVTFNAQAYPLPCKDVQKQAPLPNWVSDSQSAFLQGGIVTPVSLTLRPNGVAVVDVDFKPDQPPPPPPAELEFEPFFYDFDFVPTGGISSNKFALVNRSKSETVHAKVYLQGEGFFLDADDCFRPLRPGDRCHVGVSFAPKYEGYFSGLVVADSGRAQAYAKVQGHSVDQPPPPPPGLIGHWRFGKSNMYPYVNDLSGNNNTGVVVRGTDPKAPPAEPNLVPGRNGETALDLSNQTWVRVASSESINRTGINGTFSLAAWVSTTAPAPSEELESVISRNEAGTPFQHFGLGFLGGRPTGSVHFFFTSAPEVTPRDGSWQHIATTYDGIDIKVYVNGELTSTSAIGWPIAADTTDVVLGAQQEFDTKLESNTISHFFPGLLDEARIYDSYLSDAEVKALAQQ